ncbi:sulfotransferase family protein [Mycobacterium sp. 94-17]|uniref:sulfotransferase family protein n=1 Tax=Mycobacterium sp. 94-17 TaxID=2986147 RepID=UPI002D1F920A|nr:sulfotransferase family protein [Mycobacterium sp. 94-17]MEB4212192.1 sulfotransferase family protein [Mycobacterium sp. 94-17]
MSRSGTSALTRVLSLCGGTLPAALAGANSANPRGYWEPRKTLHLNAVILRRHGSAMIDPSLRLEEEGAFDAKQQSAYVAEIRAYLKTLPAAPLVVIKDPQITALTGMWFEAARLEGIDTVAVIAVRNPDEVTASVTASNPMTQELSSALWLKFNLLAERHTRDIPRVFVEYPNLLEDWRREIKRISVALAIDLNCGDESAIEGFLEDDLRRQRHCGPMTEPFGTDWNSVAYEALSAAARDEPWDQAALDRVFEAYRATEYSFRRAHEDFRRNFKKPIFWPSLQKTSMAIGALLHRRRGPWA